jgi:drug/metabolite transporter (DMT)-like permease
MTAIGPFYLTLCIMFSASLAVGQLLFKLGARQIAGAADPRLALLSPYLVAAVALYAATTVLWVFILQKLPLSTAYPFALLGAVLVFALSAIVLNEPLPPRLLLGMGVVAIGMLIIYA